MELEMEPSLTAVSDVEDSVDLQAADSGVLPSDEAFKEKRKIFSRLSGKVTATRLCLEVLLIVTIFVGVGVLSVLITVGVCHSSHSDHIAKPVVTQSSEYQVSLFPDDWSTSEARHNNVEEFLRYVERRLSVDLSFDDGDISIRKQYYYHMKDDDQCSAPYIARVREHRSGVDEGLMYIDLKFSDSSKSKACSVPIWPANAPPFGLFADPSEYSMKCEHDIHACMDKYSSESRMVFSRDLDSPVDLFTCNDIGTLYPWALEETKEQQRFNALKRLSSSYWWYWTVTGYIDADGHVGTSKAEGRMGTTKEATQFKIDFTVEYNSESHAESGNKTPKNGSEWSIKIWELSSGEYDSTVQRLTAKLHHDLLNDFGSKGEFEDGTCQ